MGRRAWRWKAPAGLTAPQPVHFLAATFGAALQGRARYQSVAQSLHQLPRPVGLLRFRWYAIAGLTWRHLPQAFSFSGGLVPPACPSTAWQSATIAASPIGAGRMLLPAEVKEQ